MLNQSFSLGAIVMHHGITLPELNHLFCCGAIVMRLGVTNCYWFNFLISGSVPNQSFSNGTIVMHLGRWGNSLFLGTRLG